MNYQMDTEISINIENNNLTTYIISSKHRATGNPNKSVWSITHHDEINCFTLARKSNWTNESNAWGLHLIDSKIMQTGMSTNGETLKLAKFVDGSKNDIWHGYPADYLRKTQDIPPETILRDWVSLNYLTKSKMLKILRGKKCKI